jgi:hypothetical protein
MDAKIVFFRPHQLKTVDGIRETFKPLRKGEFSVFHVWYSNIHYRRQSSQEFYLIYFIPYLSWFKKKQGMKRTIWMFTLCMVGYSLMNACSSSDQQQKTTQQHTDTANREFQIPYNIAKNYFVNNTYRSNSLLGKKINDANTFNEIFGMATVMGENGKPTSIDFSREFVIALIGEVSENEISYSPISLKETDGHLSFEYAINTKKATGALMQSSFIMIVDKQFEKDSVAFLVRTE